MAISATQLKALHDLGKTQVTSKEVEDTLSVTASWVSKNKQGLKDFGIEVVRAAHKPHKPHKPHKDHGTKGKSPEHFMQRFKDEPIIGSTIYRLDKHLILRYLTNKVFEENSLPKIAVITEPANLLELIAAKVDAELSDTKTLKDYVDWVLDQHMPDTSSEMDYMTQRVLSGKQYLPSEIKYCLIALKHVLDSLEYLKPQEIPTGRQKVDIIYEKSEGPYEVYLVVDVSSDTLLYIGQGVSGRHGHVYSGTSHVYGLNYEHFQNTPLSIRVVPFTEKESANLVESYLIVKLRPKYNRVGLARPYEDIQEIANRLRERGSAPEDLLNLDPKDFKGVDKWYPMLRELSAKIGTKALGRSENP